MYRSIAFRPSGIMACVVVTSVSLPLRCCVVYSLARSVLCRTVSPLSVETVCCCIDKTTAVVVVHADEACGGRSNQQASSIAEGLILSSARFQS